jgi:putative peptidoglycan lipid II flippase
MKKTALSAVRLGAILLAGSSLLSRLLGVLRDHVFAQIFGLGLDAYYLAFRIPDLLYTLLILGALSSAFIPLYTRLNVKDPREGDRFASQVLNAVFLALLLLAGFLFLLAPWLLPILAPGFSAVDVQTAVDLTRLMLLSPIFLGLSGVLQGIENVHKKFWGMALAPILYNVSIISAAWFFGPEYGVYGLAWGVILGAFLHFLVQLPGAIFTPFHYRFAMPGWTKTVKEFFTLALPRVFGMAAAQLTLVVDYALASTLSLGAVSVYSYSLNLQSFPYGVVAVSFSVAVFSTLAEQALKANKTEFVSTLRRSFQAIWFLAFPAVVGLFLLREPVIELILQGGSFDADAARQTTETFAILIWAALPQSLIPLWSRAFYSLSNTRTPVLIAVFTMLLNVGLSLFLLRVLNWPVYGLAVSNLVSGSFNALLLLAFLKRDLKTAWSSLLPIKDILLALFATLVMSLCVYYLERFNYPHLAIELGVTAGLGACAYFLVSKLSHKS